jgi:TonB-dependent receptor
MLVIRRVCTHTIGWLLAGLLLISLPVFGQSNKGAISGSIADKSGSVLKGARIELLPLGITSTANSQGEFELRDITPGHYTLTVSYIGFKPYSASVDLTAGKTLNLDLKLEVASKREEILVTAERAHGEAESINQTRTADNIIDSLPAEVITSLPNANVADALGRLPGVVLERSEGEGEYVDIRGLEPRLTNITIDGITVPSPEPQVRQVRLDVINSDLVDAVEINKTLSANQDGDGIAGSVNLRTKMATDQTLFSLYSNGGYTPILNGRAADQFGGIFGKRFGENKKFGFILGGTYDYNGRGIDNFQPALDPLSTFAQPFYDDNTLREYRYYRTRYGYTGGADYKLNDNNSFYAHGLFSDLKDWGDKWYYSPQSTAIACPASGPCNPSTYIYPQSTDASPNPKFYTSSKRPNAAVSMLSLGGRHVQQSSWFTWEVAAARSYEVDSAGNPKADFSWLGQPTYCNYIPANQTNVNVPKFGNPTTGFCDQAGSPLLNASLWTLKDLTVSRGLTSDLNLSAATSYAKNYTVGSHFGTFEVGFKIRNGHKTQDATETVYDGFSKKDPALLMSALQSGFENNGNYFGGSYFGGKFGPVSDFNKVANYVTQNLPADVDGYKTASDTFPNIFHTVERITAGYVMNTLSFGKLRVQTGLRFEGTQMDTFGYTVTLFSGAGGTASSGLSCVSANDTGCGVATPVINNPSYLDVLPSVQLRYSLPGNSDLRAVYSRGVARPDPYQLVPYATEDETASPTALTIGNPLLKPEHANNYDLLYEKYLQPFGMFQAGGFFKQLTAPQIELTNVPFAAVPVSLQPIVLSYNGSGDSISMFVNGENAYVYGFETSYLQHWSRLPGVLNGLGVSANYTYTGSQEKGIYMLRSDHPALQRQTPNSWNLSPTYDTKRVSVRVGLQYSGASIYTYNWSNSTDQSGLGPKGPDGDIYTYAHTQLDAQGSYRIGRGFSLMAYGLNLTNEVFGFYQGSTQFVNQREYYKPTYGGGLRYTFGQER